MLAAMSERKEAGASEEPRLSDELDAFLRAQRRAYWVTLRRDGSPTAHPMGALYEDGRVLFTSYRKSAKNRNADRDPRKGERQRDQDHEDEPHVLIQEHEGRAFSAAPGSRDRHQREPDRDRSAREATRETPEPSSMLDDGRATPER